MTFVPTAEGTLICDRCAHTAQNHGWGSKNPCPVRDESDLTPQLIGLEGARVEVVTDYGETRRFWVSRSTGWRPIHIEVKLATSTGGFGTDKHYQSVKVLRRGRAS